MQRRQRFSQVADRYCTQLLRRSNFSTSHSNTGSSQPFSRRTKTTRQEILQNS